MAKPKDPVSTLPLRKAKEPEVLPKDFKIPYQPKTAGVAFTIEIRPYPVRTKTRNPKPKTKQIEKRAKSIKGRPS